jgi:muconolactone D-isomerase
VAIPSTTAIGVDHRRRTGPGGRTVEFLVTMTTHVPDGTPDATVDEVRGREAARSRQLAADGNLLRLWRPPLAPGEWRTIGLFAAADADALEEVLASMPLRIWRTDEVTPLAPHPNDPAVGRS